MTDRNVRPTKGGEHERRQSFDSGGVGKAWAGDCEGWGGAGQEGGAEEEWAADAAAAGVVHCGSGVGPADHAGTLDHYARACDGSGSSGASVRTHRARSDDST